METTLERVEFVQRRIAERLEQAKELREKGQSFYRKGGVLSPATEELADSYIRQAKEVEIIAQAQKNVLVTLFPQLDR